MTRGGLQVGGNFRGAWDSDTQYARNDTVTNNETLYSANVDHTSGLSFDGNLWKAISAGGSALVADTAPPAHGVAARVSALPLPTGSTDTYNSFPALERTAGGEFVAVSRIGPTHMGPSSLWLWRSLTGEPESWLEPVLLRTPPVLGDARDPCLYRRPNTRRLYMTWEEIYNTAQGASENRPLVILLAYSDKDGEAGSWSDPVTISSNSHSTGMRLRYVPEAGRWYLPTFKLLTINESWLLSTDDPVNGPWTETRVAWHATDHRNEWDFFVASKNNWVAVHRNSGGKQPVTSQSTDGLGEVWTQGALMDSQAGELYDGWPTMHKMSDGSAFMTIRAPTGIRVLTCKYPEAPLVANAWRDRGTNGSLLVFDSAADIGSGGFPYGKLQMIRDGASWYGVHYGERDAGRTLATVWFDTIHERNLRSGFATRTTGELPPAAGSYQSFPTPDRVRFRSRGERIRGLYQVVSTLASGALSNYAFRLYAVDVSGVAADLQIGLTFDHNINNMPGQTYNVVGGSGGTVTVGLTTTPVTDTMIFEGFLPAGTYDIELKVLQNSVPYRSYASRQLYVGPI